MEEKNRLFVFEKKEVLLIFVFIVVIASTSFTLGVKMGMNWQLEKVGVTEADKNRVEQLKSQKEEYVDKILKDEDKKKEQEDIKAEAKARLMEEIERASNVKDQSELMKKEADSPKADTKDLIDSYKITEDNSKVVEQTDNNKEQIVAQNLKGKFTIQVGAYKTLEEAKDFSSGFEVRGYSPLINEVKISGKGTWFRVSLGAFETRSEAKDYIVKEKALFQSYDYIIKQIE